jgi:PAS domain S-box-containing protein
VLLAVDGRIISANHAAASMLGYTTAEMAERSVVALTHPDERAHVQQVLDAVATRRGTSIAFEGRYLHRDGRTVNALVSGAVVPQPESGAPYLVAQLHDISERKALGERLRQAHKLEAVGRLAGGVAHDFNNLLQVVESYASALIEDLHPSDPRRADLSEILKATAAGADLTRQLLAFSRQQVIAPKVVELSCVVAYLEPLLRRLIHERITLATRFGGTPIHVLIDPGQLEQIVVNLAVNARDAMPEGGTLTIEAATTEMGASEAGKACSAEAEQFATLTVSDTGVGMDDETRHRIFEPFFTTKATGKGTGLGLATVYGIVKQHGGSVMVKSRPGAGAEFKVLLPLAKGPCDTASTAEPETARPQGGEETILLVEDDAAVRLATRQVLHRYGYNVLDVPSPLAAIDRAAAHIDAIHLLLTDVVMPDLTGREVAERIRRVRPGIRVLYMSGYTEDVIEQQGALEPGFAFIPKPFAPAALARTVRRVLDGG